MTLIPYFWNLVLLDCYRNKMDAKDKEFYDIVFNNCTEEEIYAILLKKKETSWAKLYGPTPSLPYGKGHPALHRNGA